MQKEIKKAVDLAEQEIQEKEIAKLKTIIKDLLENKVRLEKNKHEVEKEISVIKQTIDDFKAGRLDKIKELQEKDSLARRILPFQIVIINQPVITQPWNWQYQITRGDYIGSAGGGGGYLNATTGHTATLTSMGALGGNLQMTYAAQNIGLLGAAYGNFTGGSYEVNNTVIHL